MSIENQDTIIDDAEKLTDMAPEQPKKKRGRKPGQQNGTGKAAGGNAQTGKKEKLSARQITGILFLSHSAAANALNQPLIAIDKDEAAQIADAAVDVLQYYDFEASAKTVAWCNLFGTLATVYGLRVWSILQNKNYQPIGGYVDDATGD